MRTSPRRWPSIGTATTAIAAAGAVVIAAAWYVGDTDAPGAAPAPVDLGGAVRLVAYDNCDAALADLKAAALAKVGPWGLDTPHDGMARGLAEDSAASAPPGQDRQQGHSTTNTHEAAADEPDTVKTDGKRIVSVVDGKLRVLDVATRTAGAVIALPGHASSVLLSGERALVAFMPEAKEDAHWERSGLALVDLPSGKVLRTLTVDGMHIDARMVRSVARVVLRSSPRLEFTYPQEGVSESKAKAKNREVIERSKISDWLPEYTLSPGTSGTLDCAGLSRPSGYTGTSLLNLLTVDVTADLTVQDTVSIAADGDTVYGTGTSLYVADDRTPRWNVIFQAVDVARPMPQDGPGKTDVHQFDISAPGKPVYVASGSVDGWLLNQYSLSEHNGKLRIATTTGNTMCCWGPRRPTRRPRRRARCRCWSARTGP
ncbi:beta-propeller domain-containing protein [Actinokineospora soli]|uniref:Beta-propeller domain-containing protein n=1 Tax=Actinokineospora soli TaxID=1048753 RepID=A0ABW2TRW6_9PSEU